jgi:predicted nucleic acid-binding protein
LTRTRVLDENVVKQTIAIRKTHKIKLPDAVIAATALVYGLSLISRNEADFKKIPHLSRIDLHKMI